MSELLTIAIPTFNRNQELDRCLKLVFGEITGDSLEADVGVCVYDNCSQDETIGVLTKYCTIAESKGLQFKYKVQEKNFGPDKNTIDVYDVADSKYVWWFSDDDMIKSGELGMLINDLKKYKPTVAVSGFLQPPFSPSNLPFEDSEYGLHGVSDEALKALVKRAKITSYVVKKGWYDKSLSLDGSYWGFLGVAMSLFFEQPSLLIRKNFVASCDDNYLNIRYHPNVSLKQYNLISEVFLCYGVSHKINLIPKPDILIQTSQFLESHYRRRATLSDDLIIDIKHDVVKGMLENWNWLRGAYFKQLARLVLAGACYHLHIRY